MNNRINKNMRKTRVRKERKGKSPRTQVKRQIKMAMLCAALSGTLAAGGIMAYFTDNETAENTFTVGKVSLSLIEPKWVVPKNIAPNQEIDKDPQIKNDGVNAEYVFMEVTVPYGNIVTANQDGTRKAAADTEFFEYTLNTGWAELGSAKKNELTKTMTRLYVYGTSTACTELTAGTTTNPLFEKVTFVNAVEGQDLEATNQEVTVKAYGIQTTDINGGKRTPDEVWKALSNQLSAS